MAIDWGRSGDEFRVAVANTPWPSDCPYSGRGCPRYWRMANRAAELQLEIDNAVFHMDYYETPKTCHGPAHRVMRLAAALLDARLENEKLKEQADADTGD